MAGKATFLMSLKEGWAGDARLYRIEPPLDGHDWVIVSVVKGSILSGPEAAIFACDENGDVMPSFKSLGDGPRMDHAQILEEAGYSIR